MKQGKRVAYYSMEMTNLELTQRLLSMECRVNVNALARLKLEPEQEVRAFHAIDSMIANNAVNFNFDERGVNHLDRMLQSIRVLKRTRGLDLVVVDYIQLLGIDPITRDACLQGHLARPGRDHSLPLADQPQRSGKTDTCQPPRQR